jgi:hypothetical protein
VRNRLVLAFVIAFALFSVSPAITVTIGDLYSTSTTNYFPLNCYYNYSYTQQIYTQAQIGQPGEIRKLRFNYYSGTATNSSNWTIYLGNTTRSNFPSYTSSNWIPVSAMTQVFSGTVTFPSEPGWMEVTLTTPFQYNGVDNMVLAVDENSPGYSSGYVRWQGFSSALNSGIYHYSDSVNANPASPPNAINTNAFLSELQIVFASLDPPDPAVSPYPANLAINADVRYPLTWQAGATEPTSYDVFFGTSSPPPFVGNQSTKSFNPGTMACETQYYWQIVPKNAYGDAANCPIWSFTTWTDPTISTFPFAEGFNATLFPPVGWKNTVVSGGQGFYRDYGTSSNPTITTTFEGSGRVRYPGHYLPGDAVAWLATPEIVMQDNTYHYRVRLAFWKDSTAVATGSLDRIELYLNTVQSLSGSPTLIGTLHRSKSQYPVETGPDGWYQYSFDIGAGVSGSRYLIVKALNLTWNYFGNDMCFDHLELLEESAIVPPLQPISPRPVINTVNASIRPSLSWQNGGGDPSGYRVYFGTNQDEMTLVTDQSGTSYTLTSNLLWGTSYFWRVDAYNDFGVTTGTVWNFSTLTEQPQITSPSHNATGVAITSLLNWGDVANATGYQISVGTSPGASDVADHITCPSSQWQNSSPWLYNQTYYWKVYIINGSQVLAGPEWVFTTATGQPQSPNPANAQASVNLNASLNWQAVSGATGYLITVGTTEGGSDVADRISCATNQWINPSNWHYAQSYYWKVYVLNGEQEIAGPQWSFTTKTLSIGTPTPSINATGIALNTMLNWPDVEYASAYKISVGTSSGSSNIAEMIDCEQSQWTPPANLLFNQSYYWTVYVINGTQEIAGPEWVFTTTTGQPLTPNPTSGQTSVNLNVTLNWQAVSGASGYLIRVGTTDGGTDVAARIPCVTNQWIAPAYWYFTQTYYWQVCVLNGEQEIAGPQWSFTTKSMSIGTPSPANIATNIAVNTILNWPDVEFATAYKISVGTTSGSSNVAEMIDCAQSQWTPPANLLYNQSYYWTVYVVNGAQVVAGTQWSFTTLGGVATTPAPANNSTGQNYANRVLSWTAVSNASGYRVKVGTSSGASDLVNMADVTTNRYTHTSNWPTNTRIYWTVFTLNGGQQITGTEWNFTTTTSMPLPYSENFNASPSFPINWSGNWYIGTPHGTDGSIGIYRELINFTSAAETSPLIGPVTNCTRLQFDYRFVGFNSYPNNAHVLIDYQFVTIEVSKNNGSSYSTLRQIDRTNHVTSNQFVPCTLDINAVSGEMIKLRFSVLSTSGAFIVDIDNIRLDSVLYAPSAISPLPNATNVALDPVLDWSDVDIATGYLLNVGTSPGASDIANAVPCSQSQWTFNTGWSYNQPYYWQVVAIKDDVQVSSPEWSFTTVSDVNNINGYALSLNGSSQYVDCGNPAGFNNLTAITLEAWIYPTNFLDAAHKNTIIGKDYWGAGNNEGFAFRYGSGNRTLSFVVSNGTTGWNEVTAINALTLNTWQHVAATYNGSAMKIYVNGIQVGSLNRTGAIPPSARDLLIGQCPAAARYMNGSIDEVRIWNIARSAQDISNDRYTELPPQSNLVAYYRMTNGNGSLLSDNSGNGNTATLINNPVWNYNVPLITLVAPLVMISSDSTPGNIRLSWTAVNGAAWYAVYTADEPSADLGTGTPNYVTTGLFMSLPATSPTKRFFKVTAGVGNQPGVK